MDNNGVPPPPPIVVYPSLTPNLTPIYHPNPLPNPAYPYIPPPNNYNPSVSNPPPSFSSPLFPMPQTVVTQIQSGVMVDDNKSKRRSVRVGGKDSKGIVAIKNQLKLRECHYICEVRFSACRDQRELPFDIMIFVDGKVGIIEYDGKQHFTATSFGGNEKKEDIESKLGTQITHDITKNKFTRDANISLLRISYNDDDKIPELVDKFISSIKYNSKPPRIELFSNPTDYKNVYGEPESTCLIQ